jgi:hypothetical protein
MKENNTTYSTDAVAIISMETHTSMNWITNKCRRHVNASYNNINCTVCIT